ncbi:phosphoheptose isomerase [Idiomarina tyrosinivorans]|uniref:Phosphoheptose isomerase n=1 Tax=Idiomarina tyrosinivorans TaxID=1445662 RepID=A0A432ZQB2_9GAMM|nr:SIS domain-containing protein [Idiomarina tyrosinivorans]RUO80094.1 phosphoheptose isomerase [Idiomarina tyrosinivorans]
MTNDALKALFTESIQTQISAVETLQEPVSRAVELFVERLLQGQRVYCCGEAGGAFVASQFVRLMTDGMKLDRPPFPTIHLDQSKARQVNALGQAGDVLLVVANHPDSELMTNIMEAALSRQMVIVALTCETDDAIAGLLGANDVEIRIPSRNPSRVIENQLLVVHCLAELVEARIFPQEHEG